jgi:hypothetical protein
MAVMRMTVEPARKKFLEVLGAYITLSCVVGVPLVLFILAPACSAVGGFLLLLVGLGLVTGILLWLIGKFGVRSHQEPDIRH